MTSQELKDKLCRIPGVLGAHVVFNGDEVSEVHVMADSRKHAKEVMLDVKSVLFVCLEQPVDFRKISVALIDTSENGFEDQPAASAGTAPRESRVMLVAAYTKKISSERYQAVVEIGLNGETIVGTSYGMTIQDATHTVVPDAFVDAVTQIAPEFRILHRIEMLGSYCIADLTVSEGDGSPAQNLIGAVRRTGDTPWDVSRAMLQAINRRLGRFLSGSTLRPLPGN